MSKTIKTHAKEYLIDRTNREAMEALIDRLAVVAAVPHRWLGVVEPGVDLREPFVVYGALLYFCNLGFQEIRDKDTSKVMGMRASTQLHAAAPFDLLDAVNVTVMAANLIWIRDMNSKAQTFLLHEFLAFWDPPKVELPSVGLVKP
jgi:hypothetical protein